MRIHVKPQLKEGRVSGVQIIIDDITKTKQLEEKLLRLSVMDVLTDTYNRRYIISKIEEQIDHFKEGSRFSVIMMDIDHFKKFNDEHGHTCGDEVLKNVANIVMQNVRQIDLAARYGGAEFAVVLPGTTRDDAVIVAERIRISVEKAVVECDAETLGVTISLGVAEFKPTADRDNKSFIERADKALYLSKATGRNRVSFL
jgi:diguanylate cyclase (GGDEF)-like protein